MQTTAQFLDAIKIKTGIHSDYGLAEVLGVTSAAVSHYRVTSRAFGDKAAFRVAELLGIDPGYVVACSAAQRAKSPKQKKLWEGIAKKMAGASVVVLLALTGLSMAPLSDVIAADQAIHYTKLIAEFIALGGLGAILRRLLTFPHLQIA
jgi:Phage related protein